MKDRYFCPYVKSAEDGWNFLKMAINRKIIRFSKNKYHHSLKSVGLGTQVDFGMPLFFFGPKKFQFQKLAKFFLRNLVFQWRLAAEKLLTIIIIMIPYSLFCIIRDRCQPSYEEFASVSILALHYWTEFGHFRPNRPKTAQNGSKIKNMRFLSYDPSFLMV